MDSQKSTAPAVVAIEPKRRRGHLRVAAIMDAGAAIFAERGYDAATMTEIAARAETAIGSLYRFFPTKEVLAAALLDRYWRRLGEALDAIAARTGQLSPPEVAEALVGLMLGLQRDRDAALNLIEAQGDAASKRAMLRGGMRQKIAAIILLLHPRLSAARSAAMAVLVLQVLKLVPTIAREEEGAQPLLLEEARRLIRLYLETVAPGEED